MLTPERLPSRKVSTFLSFFLKTPLLFSSLPYKVDIFTHTQTTPTLDPRASGNASGHTIRTYPTPRAGLLRKQDDFVPAVNFNPKKGVCSKFRVLSPSKQTRILEQGGPVHPRNLGEESDGGAVRARRPRTEAGGGPGGAEGGLLSTHSASLSPLIFVWCLSFVCLFVLITVKKTETKPTRPASLPRPSALSGTVVCSHSRQRQKRVGMKTPKATRMGNMRLLLSEA